MYVRVEYPTHAEEMQILELDHQRQKAPLPPPRASIALARCARARAWLDGERFVTPQHIRDVALEILRHRVLLSFEAEAEGVSTDDFIRRLMELVAIP
jgi:MoxR-like ATPase